MQIPHSLLEEIRQGRAILFMGAGASLGAKDKSGNEPPLGVELGTRIGNRFLGDGYEDQSLQWVGELAQSEADLVAVQNFIAAQFSGFEPADFHKKISNYRWRAIATVNYDRIIEESYLQNSERVQDLVPVISDTDRVDEKLRTADQLALLKLHGCVTVTERSDLPLILTVDQYVTHLKNRKYLFNRLEEWASQCSIVFIGHSLQDSNLRSVLINLSEKIETRPRYYLVSPGKGDVEKRFFESKRITVLDGTFEDFLNGLDEAIPERQQRLLQLVRTGHPVETLFIVQDKPSPELQSFLSTDVEFVHSGMAFGTGTAAAFYRGFDLGWYPVREGLDVRRGLTDKLLHDVIIRPEADRPTKTELYVIKGEAGAGKSVLLRRVAWEAATEAGVLTLVTSAFGRVDAAPLRELHRATGQRIFLFWDHAADNATEMARFTIEMRKSEFPVTVITTERPHSWNTKCDQLEPILTGTYQLNYLNEAEVVSLVTLLKTNNALGAHLASKSFGEQVKQFQEQAGRQLLVALHEATLGERFEDIIAGEYDKIRPNRAKLLYLTVCVLNRLRVPVRAGLISRVHDIAFSDFREELFLPLEKVVMVEERPATGDYFYRARHPLIAQIVFDRALQDSDDRFHEYARIIEHLNLSYDVDKQSFRGLLRAKSIHELFPDHQQANTLFEFAQKVAETEAYIYQQRAIYERIRPNGNLAAAEDYLGKAKKLAPRDNSITHTFAEHYRSRAEKADTVWERRKFRRKAADLLRDLITDPRSTQFACGTQVRMGIDELRDVLEGAKPSEREIDQAIREVEKLLEKYLQRYPNDGYLLTAEADLGSLVSQHQRAFDALYKASKANPRDPYVASRLARAYDKKGERKKALETLENALKVNPGDSKLRFKFAEKLRADGSADIETMSYHYERSFTPGDSNYEAQFWFARFAFESSESRLIQRSRDVFQSLRRAPISHSKRMDVRDVIRDNGVTRKFKGSADRMEESYGRVLRDGPSDLIFVHENNVDAAVWAELRMGRRVAFEVGFNLAGPTALQLALC